MIDGVRKPVSRTAIKSFNKLVSAAEVMFYTKGYFNTTIGDIVTRAEVGTGTFYIYFDNKYPMYEYIMTKYERELKTTLRESIKGCKTRLEIEVTGVRAFIKHAYANPTCYNLIWESLYINKELFYNYYRVFASSYVYGLIRAGKEIREDIDLETLAYVLMGISNFVGLQAISGKKLTEDKLNTMCNTIQVLLENGVFKTNKL
ncbi:MAG: TetR/AcrR family transcriptional regulator [Clostridia bacterium]|nr:TetR/AcrR family transcriptional regulator [Clostridia bacterium]